VGPGPGGGELPARAEQAWVWHGGGEGRGADQPDARDGRQPLTGLVLSVPGQQAPFEGVDLKGEGIELISQHQQGGSREIGESGGLGLAHLLDELRHPPRPLAWTWKTLLARSRPIVVIRMVDGSC
jgi:hypothetical protein